MCTKAWFSRAQITHCLSCHYTRCAVLIYQTSRCSRMWRGCPPTDVLFFTSSQKNTHLGLTHATTNRDKRAHINIRCLVPEQLRLLNDSDNKSSMSCLCYGKRSNIPTGLRDMGVISFVHDCSGRDLLWQGVSGSFWQRGVMHTIIMQTAINDEQVKNRSAIPVEPAQHHAVVDELPFPPEVHWTVQLQDKIRSIFITLKLLGRKTLLTSGAAISTSHKSYVEKRVTDPASYIISSPLKSSLWIHSEATLLSWL